MVIRLWNYYVPLYSWNSKNNWKTGTDRVIFFNLWKWNTAHLETHVKLKHSVSKKLSDLHKRTKNVSEQGNQCLLGNQIQNAKGETPTFSNWKTFDMLQEIDSALFEQRANAGMPVPKTGVNTMITWIRNS